MSNSYLFFAITMNVFDMCLRFQHFHSNNKRDITVQKIKVIKYMFYYLFPFNCIDHRIINIIR